MVEHGTENAGVDSSTLSLGTSADSSALSLGASADSGPRRCERKWLSGRASPCQGEGRGFKSRLPLHASQAARSLASGLMGRAPRCRHTPRRRSSAGRRHHPFPAAHSACLDSTLPWRIVPEWRNGRRGGLKIRWGITPCQFDSDLRHHPDFMFPLPRRPGCRPARHPPWADERLRPPPGSGPLPKSSRGAYCCIRAAGKPAAGVIPRQMERSHA